MAASKAARGAFILFEGVDRCGKTTQSTLLVETLKRAGVRAELWRYPDRTTGMGVMINSYLQSKTEMDDGAIHLLFAANRWEKKKAMEAALAEGITLVVDRYSYSGVAFTAAKKIPGLDLEWCKSPERGLVRPDAVLYLNMPIDAARGRGGFGEERYETETLQREVRAQFEKLTEDWWTVVDADRTVEQVAEAFDAARARRRRAVRAWRGVQKAVGVLSSVVYEGNTIVPPPAPSAPELSARASAMADAPGAARGRGVGSVTARLDVRGGRARGRRVRRVRASTGARPRSIPRNPPSCAARAGTGTRAR